MCRSTAQIPGDFNDETWDFSDEDDLQTDLHTTIAETAIPQDDINTPNHSLNPVASVNPAMENGPPLSSTLEQDTITHTHTATTPTNDGATHVHSTEESHDSELQPLPSEPINADEASIHGINESQLVINPSDSQSTDRLDEEDVHLQNDSVLASPVFPTPSTRSSSPLSYLSYIDSDDEDQDAAIQHSEIHLDTSLAVPHTPLDPDIPIAHDTSLAPIISSTTPEFSTQLSWDVAQLESSLGHSLGHPQTTQTTLDPNALIEHDSLSIISKPSLELLSISEPPIQAVQEMVESWQILIGKDEEAVELPRLPASDPAASDTHSDVNEGQQISKSADLFKLFNVTPLLLALNSQTDEASQNSRSSKEELEDAIHEVDSPRYSNTGSADRRNSFASNKTRNSAESSQLSPIERKLDVGIGCR